MNRVEIPFVKEVKYLAVIFNQKLTWNSHIEKSTTKSESPWEGAGKCQANYNLWINRLVAQDSAGWNAEAAKKYQRGHKNDADCSCGSDTKPTTTNYYRGLLRQVDK